MDVEEAYSNLEEIVTRGFITLGIRYNGFNIVLKSLTDKEVQYLKLKHNLSTYDELPIMDKILYSTLFVNSVDFLEIRIKEDSRLEGLEAIYERMPVSLMVLIIKGIEDLLNTYVQSIKFLEGFCHSDDSKSLWNLYKTNRYKIQKAGIEYSQLDNTIKDRWIHVNTTLDDEVAEDHRLNNSVFIASAMNPKGVKSVSDIIKREKEKLEKEREEIAEYGYSKLRIKEKTSAEKWSTPLISNEDMVRELNRAVRGEKDKHDLFIDEWIRRKKSLADAKEAARIESAKKYRKEFDEKSLDTEGTRRVTQEELNKIIDMKNKTKSNHLGSYSSSYEDYGKSDAIMRKIGSRILKSE